MLLWCVESGRWVIYYTVLYYLVFLFSFVYCRHADTTKWTVRGDGQGRRLQETAFGDASKGYRTSTTRGVSRVGFFLEGLCHFLSITSRETSELLKELLLHKTETNCSIFRRVFKERTRSLSFESFFFRDMLLGDQDFYQDNRDRLGEIRELVSESDKVTREYVG